MVPMCEHGTAAVEMKESKYELGQYMTRLCRWCPFEQFADGHFSEKYYYEHVPLFSVFIFCSPFSLPVVDVDHLLMST